MQKRSLFLAAMIASLFVGGCDTNVPTDEIAPMLTLDARCGFSQGVPLTTAQALKVKELVQITNDYKKYPTESSETWGFAGMSLSEDVSSPEVRAKLVGLVTNIRTKLQNSKLLYGSFNMRYIYEFAYTLGKGDQQDVYCACGYEFCDQGVACSFDDLTNMPICAANTTVDPTLTTECNPMNIKFSAVSEAIMVHQRPLVYKLSLFKDLYDKDYDVTNHYSAYEAYKEAVEAVDPKSECSDVNLAICSHVSKPDGCNPYLPTGMPNACVYVNCNENVASEDTELCSHCVKCADVSREKKKALETLLNDDVVKKSLKEYHNGNSGKLGMYLQATG